MFGFARKRPSADREADVPIETANAPAPALTHGWMDSAMELQQGLDVVEIDTLPADLFAFEGEHPPRRCPA